MSILVKESRALRELEKFFSLINIEGRKEDLYMPNSYIDEVWHNLLEDEKKYIEFCNKTVGCYVDHIPGGGVAIFEWVKLYENKYGKLDIAWFIDSKGNFNDKVYEVYIKEGTVKMAWDCGPGISIPDNKYEGNPDSGENNEQSNNEQQNNK